MKWTIVVILNALSPQPADVSQSIELPAYYETFEKCFGDGQYAAQQWAYDAALASDGKYVVSVSKCKLTAPDAEHHS